MLNGAGGRCPGTLGQRGTGGGDDMVGHRQELRWADMGRQALQAGAAKVVQNHEGGVQRCREMCVVWSSWSIEFLGRNKKEVSL